MKKINVVIPTGENTAVDLVRYFDAYNKKYFVYTLNEKDEQGFVKLYVCRINNVEGEFIDDDNEWKLVKDEFKKIIGENSDSGTTSINDLNPNELDNVNVRGHRVIKLMENYVSLLSANQKEFTQVNEAPNAPVNNFEMPGSKYEAPSAPVNNFGMPGSGYETPNAPVNNFEMPGSKYETPSAPTSNFGMPGSGYETPSAPTSNFGMPGSGYETPSAPTSNFGMPGSGYETPSASVNNFGNSSANNYEQMYNEMKEKFDRCNAELEKVTNENVELRIKIDDIREILNEN